MYINDDYTPTQRKKKTELLDKMRTAKEQGNKSYISQGMLYREGTKIDSLDLREPILGPYQDGLSKDINKRDTQDDLGLYYWNINSLTIDKLIDCQEYMTSFDISQKHG